MNNQGLTARQLTERMPGFTWNQVRSRREVLRARVRDTDREGPWSEIEIDWLVAMVTNQKTRREVAEELKRSANQVRAMIEKLGVTVREGGYVDPRKVVWDLPDDAFKDMRLKPVGRFTDRKPDSVSHGLGQWAA